MDCMDSAAHKWLNRILIFMLVQKLWWRKQKFRPKIGWEIVSRQYCGLSKRDFTGHEIWKIALVVHSLWNECPKSMVSVSMNSLEHAESIYTNFHTNRLSAISKFVISCNVFWMIYHIGKKIGKDNWLHALKVPENLKKQHHLFLRYKDFYQNTTFESFVQKYISMCHYIPCLWQFWWYLICHVPSFWSKWKTVIFQTSTNLVQFCLTQIS